MNVICRIERGGKIVDQECCPQQGGVGGEVSDYRSTIMG